MSADAALNPFARGHVGSMPVASKPAASLALGTSALGPPALGPSALGPPSLGPPSLGPPSALYTEPAGEPTGEPFGEPAKPFEDAKPETDGDLVDLARRVAGFVPAPKPAAPAAPSAERALERAVRAMLERVRDRFVRRFPRAIAAEIRAETRAEETPDSLARWVSTLARGLAELDGTGSELAQHDRVMAVLRPSLRHSQPLHVLLAPWVRASDVRADIADDPDGRGVRILAYALYDATQADCAAHVVFHESKWYLLVCATYSKRAWHDVYGAMLHVAPAPRELDIKPVAVYEELAASIACEVGLVHLRLAPAAAVRLARVPRLGENLRLSLAMHLLSAGRTMPIVPGTHVLAGLREFAATEGNDLLRLIEDPYERVFTTVHTKIAASARSVGVLGEQYGRVLLSLLRMFTSTDLEDGGELGALLRATPNGHFRVVSEIPEAEISVLRSALPSDESDVEYMKVLYRLVTGEALTEDKVKAKAGNAVARLQEYSENLAAKAKADADAKTQNERWRRQLAIGGVAALGVAAVGSGVYFWGAPALAGLSYWNTGGQTAEALKLFVNAAVPGAPQGVVAALGGASSWMATIGNIFTSTAGLVSSAALGLGVARRVVTNGDSGGIVGGISGLLEGAIKFVSFADLALNDEMSKELGFEQMADLAPLVPATELAYHVTRAVIDHAIRRGAKEADGKEWKPKLDVKHTDDEDTKKMVARAAGLAHGLPNVHEEIDGMRGLYWMLVAMFVRLQIARVDEIEAGYRRHVEVAVRGRSNMLGAAIKTNATREPGAKQFPLDAIPIGAFAYSRGEGGAIAAMRRTGLETFDEFSVREHDRAVKLDQNTTVRASEIAHRVKGGERMYGPIYDADELLRTPRRVPVFATTSVKLEFVARKLAQLPVSFKPRAQHARAVESYQRFVFALRERERQALASKLGGLAAQVAPYVTVASFLAAGSTLVSPLTMIVAAGVYAASAYGPGYETTSSWFPGTEANKRALYEAAQKEYESSPSKQAALSEGMRSALYSIGVNTIPEGEDSKPIKPVPFDYRSIRAETMQSARAALGLAAAVMKEMPN